MSGPTYPISTLEEMAAIPADAVPRFLVELPAILAASRRMIAVRAAFNHAMVDAFEMQELVPTWTDDGNFCGTITVEGPEGFGTTVVPITAAGDAA